MVAQFIIAAFGQKKATLLYNNTFSCRNCEEENDEKPSSDNSTSSSDSAHALLERVKIELQIGNVSPLGNIQSLVDPYSLNSNEFGGVFSWNELDQSPKTVIWHAVQNQWCFIMVCDWRENRLVAFRAMKQIIRCIFERLENIRPLELLKKIFIVSVIIDVLLPNGNLILTHHQVALHQQKKIDSILK